MKIMFDNSIHLGQFCINNEKMRIFAKNSQIQISEKPSIECIGIESFNENTFSDNIIWGLPREPQDTFYKFMDVYHSVKNVDRICLNNEDAEYALRLSVELNINISNALTCAIAIRNKANEIHSFYSDFEKVEVRVFLESMNISVRNFSDETESVFQEEHLEKYYQDALACFRRYAIDLVGEFHV